MSGWAGGPDDARAAPTGTGAETATAGAAAGTAPQAAGPDPGRGGRWGLVARWVATLDPGYFAWVMGSGIVSIGASLLHQELLSQIALVVTEVAFVVLAIAYLARVVWFRAQVVRALRDPSTAMGYFTLVAGSDVLAVRLVMAGHPMPAVVMGAASSTLWLVLGYGLPWSILFAARRPVLGDINGTWLIWVVATQSLAVLAGDLARGSPWAALRQELPTVAVVLWGVGLMLYLTLIVVIVLRLLFIEITPAEMGPAYWIAMGATAISVRAAAGILAIREPGATQLVGELHPVLVGLSVVLWAFGTWWIPLLVLFGLWRHLVRRFPMGYEPRLWSVVFPLGMYTVASETLGRTPGLGFMDSIAQVWLWVGVGAWAAVSALLLVALWRAVLQRTPPVGPPPVGPG